MAERRMFAKTIIDSDAFLDMPLSTQSLYFHLAMRADDDGFINNPKKIQRMIGASDDDLKLLIAKRFILPFESGVVVIKHWKLHNYIQADRYKPTVYQEEKAMLEVKGNKGYTMLDAPMDTDCIQDVSSSDTQVRLGKDRLGKVRDRESDRASAPTLFEKLIPNYTLPESLKVREWITYKSERRESYKEQGLKSLLRQIENNQLTYGADAVTELIDECMANGWKGIIWDRLKKQQTKSQPRYQKQTKADELNDFYRMSAQWAGEE